jgi:methyl-accepting chemotaxis protein
MKNGISDKIIPIGLGLSILLNCIGIIAYQWAIHFSVDPAISNSISENDSIGWVALGALVINLLLIGGVAWEYHREITKPLEKLNYSISTLANNEGPALVGALSALARGDLTVRLDLPEKGKNISGGGILNTLVCSIDQLTDSLYECGHEINTITDEPCLRLCYIGSDSYIEGRACAGAMAQAISGKGEVAILLSLGQIAQVLRRKGFESLLFEKYPQIQIVEVADTQGRLEMTQSVALEVIKRHPHLSGLYVAEGGYPYGAAMAAIEAKVAGKLKIVCHDLVNETMQYLVQGVISATLGQDPYAQGYDTVIHLFNHLAAGWKPSAPRLLTINDVITADNYQQYWQEGQGILETEIMKSRRAKPIQPAKTALRIAVLGHEESTFWDPVRAGVLAAAAELEKYNATVKWIIPEADKALSVETRSTAVQSFVEEGWNGIATDIFDRGLIPYINRAVSAGIPVVAFNGEPSSLRGLMDMLFQRSHVLAKVSQDMTDAAQHTRSATQQIAETLHQMAGAATNQALSMDKASGSVQNIVRAINDIARGTESQSQASSRVVVASEQISRAIQATTQSTHLVTEATERSAETAQNGAESVRQSLQQMQSIQQTVNLSANAIDEMGKYSKQIGEVVITIEDIASQVNLLALNASIESARAGEQGRGFAVVANEIRNLATRSANATKEISAIIRNVQRSINNAVDSMNIAIQRVQEGSALATKSGQALDQLLVSAVSMQQQTQEMVQTNQTLTDVMGDLNKSIQQVTTVIQESVRATEEIKTGAKQTMGIVESVAAIVEENAASTEEMSASTQEVAHTAEGVNTSAFALHGLAQELQGAIAQFKIEGDE